jgi:hypothetical protein
VDQLRPLQERFLAYLRDADTAIKADVSGASNKERARRLSIYYNAYRIRLRASIETDHPILGRYLGDEWFETMASAYIKAYPSSQTSLRYFCNQLPLFLQEMMPFADNGVLSDLALFERLLMEVFDAADASRRDSGYLTELQAEQWPELILSFHPSLRFFVTNWNSVEIWQSITADRAPPEAVQGDQRTWLMWRNPARLTEFRSLTSDEYTMLKSAHNGANFAELCETLLKFHAEADVAPRALNILRGWLDTGLIKGGDGQN